MESKIENTGTILKNITNADGTGIIEIFNAATLYQPYQGLDTAWYVGRKLQIEKLQLTVNLTQSLSEAPIPDIAPEDTAAERQLKIAQIERNHPRMGFAVYRALDNGGWIREAQPNMQNFGSEQYIPLLQPYLTIGEVELSGTTDKIGVQIVPISFDESPPIAMAANDYVTVKGSWAQTITMVPREAGVISSTVPIAKDVTTSLTQIAPSREGRRSFVLQNIGGNRIWFLLTDSSSQVSSGNALYLDPGGMTSVNFEKWIINKPIWGIAEGGPSRVVGMEAIAP